MAKTFNKIAAQGDLYLRRIDRLPWAAVPKTANHDGQFVCAHSESGHSHVVEATPDVEYYADPKDDMKSYLVVKSVIGAALKHLREFDTHETLLIPPGIFELRRQREYVPQGWRRVQD